MKPPKASRVAEQISILRSQSKHNVLACRRRHCRNQAFALINLLDYPLHHDWLRFDCVYHLHKSRTETTTSEVFRCGIFACSSLFWRWCSLHSESSSWLERCRIFTETIFGHPQPVKNPWKRVRIVSRSTFAGNS